MTAPLVAYTAIAGQRDFDVPFPYLNLSHVEVRVNSINVPILEWVSQSRLRLSVPPGDGAFVEIRRNTPIDDALVDFQNGAVLTEEDLNTAILQLLYKQQEVTALYEASLLAAQVRLAAANGIPVSPGDVANQLANLVLEDQVLANFRQRINDIDANSNAIALTADDVIALSNSVTGDINQISALIADPVNGNVRLKSLLDTLRSDHNTLSGVVDGLLSLGDGQGIATIIQQEADARIEGDTALAATIALIGAKSGDNSAFILDINKVRVSPLESLATRLSTITSNTANNTAAITNEASTRSTAIAAEATQRNALNTALTNAINNEASIRAAAILNEQTARSTAIAAEATAREALGASFTTAINNEASTRAAAIANEQTVRANAITAEAQARNTLAATLRTERAADIAASGTQIRTDVTAQIQTETNARVSALAAEATARNLVRSDLTTLVNGETTARTAAITSEANTRASADSVFANNFTLLGAKNAGSTAFVLNESTVLVAGGVSLGTRLSGIDTSVGNVNAAVVNEQNARSSADSALSTSINTVSTNVGNLSATVSTLSSSVDGVRARYGVSLDVNGFVTGFVQNNNGSSGSFDILADRFRVTVPGQTPRTVFDVTAQGITMNSNVSINGNLVVTGSINSAQMAQGAATVGGFFYVPTNVNMTTAFQTAAEITIPMIGGAAKVDFCCFIAALGYENGTNVLYRLLRNGTEIRQGTLCLIHGEQTVYGGEVGVNPQPVYQPIASPFPFFLIDTQGATGNVTYTVQLRTPDSFYFYCTFGERQMSVTEFRR